jgi:hypothetical protein
MSRRISNSKPTAYSSLIRLQPRPFTRLQKASYDTPSHSNYIISIASPVYYSDLIKSQASKGTLPQKWRSQVVWQTENEFAASARDGWKPSLLPRLTCLDFFF